jgi:hypothetical protein
MDAIQQQLPIRYKNGATWTEFSGICLGCDCPIEPENLHGQISQIIDSVVTIEAVGMCIPCRALTGFHYRLHDDMSISDPRGRRWNMRSSFKNRLFRAMYRFIKTILHSYQSKDEK